MIIPPAVGVESVCTSKALTETVSAVLAVTNEPKATALFAVAVADWPIAIAPSFPH